MNYLFSDTLRGRNTLPGGADFHCPTLSRCNPPDNVVARLEPLKPSICGCKDRPEFSGRVVQPRLGDFGSYEPRQNFGIRQQRLHRPTVLKIASQRQRCRHRRKGFASSR